MVSQLAAAADAILNRDCDGQSPRSRRGRDGDRPQGQHLRGCRRPRALGQDAAMTTDSVFAIFSTTKAITGTAGLQLVEEGKLDLDARPRNTRPRSARLRSWRASTLPASRRLRAPKRAVTTRMLLLHTAGFGYDFFNEQYNRLAKEHGQPSVITSSKAALRTPLLFDPGDDWEYGSNIDWAGQVVEGITGKRLGEVMQERIFAPLGMASSAFTLTPDMRARLAAHAPARGRRLAQAAARFRAAAGARGPHGRPRALRTVGDYCRFIRMWLNDGAGEHGRVLKPETVRMAVQNGLGDKKVKLLPGVIAGLSNDAEFFPGLPKSWALTFMINDERRSDRPPRRRPRLGRPRQPVLLDRPPERHRRLLGDAGLALRRSGLVRRLHGLRASGL